MSIVPELRTDVALVLTGGGARAAYQIGVLRRIAREFPDTRFDIIHGVSAGAINAAILAAGSGPLSQTVEDLTRIWSSLTLDQVVSLRSISVFPSLVRWAMTLVSGGSPVTPRVRGLMDTAPLHSLLERALPANTSGHIAGISENVSRCQPRAVALSTLNYTTGQTITWVDGCDIETWERPLRRSVRTRFTLEHVMASASLPILFPAVAIDGCWYGDGGVRLTAPLAPALHLGAGRILAISTSHPRTVGEARIAQTSGYPPPAQILGQLVNAVFLDVVDEDALRMQKSNAFLRELPPELRRGYRLVDLLIIRPSTDLSLLAAAHEARLPRLFRWLMRGLGTQDTSRPDLLSLLMFEPEYLRRLIEVGEQDAQTRIDEIRALLAPSDVNVARQISV